jgi:hypothetical protein
MPRAALPLVCAVALCVVALRAAAETDDMMRWKPAICGARAGCEIVDITAPGAAPAGRTARLICPPFRKSRSPAASATATGEVPAHVRPSRFEAGENPLQPARQPLYSAHPRTSPPACRAASGRHEVGHRN